MKKKPENYFLYRTNPFRPLYHGHTGFHEPPTPAQKSLAPRNTFVLWLFADRRVARLLAATNSCEYQPMSEYLRLAKGREPITKPTTAFKRAAPKGQHSRGSRIEDLA